MVRAWSDRALDVYRLNLRENRPAVGEASARVADYFHQRGLSGPALQQETSRVVGGFATVESILAATSAKVFRLGDAPGRLGGRLPHPAASGA